jgi:hypothetical protein
VKVSNYPSRPLIPYIAEVALKRSLLADLRWYTKAATGRLSPVTSDASRSIAAVDDWRRWAESVIEYL